MKLTVFLVGTPILLFICYLLYRMRVGHVIAIHLHRFETAYDKILEETKSKELALKHSLPTFKNCPVLNRLTDNDYEQIIHILKDSPFPKKIIHKIVLNTDSKTSLKALKNAELLTQMANVGRNA